MHIHTHIYIIFDIKQRNMTKQSEDCKRLGSNPTTILAERLYYCKGENLINNGQQSRTSFY